MTLGEIIFEYRNKYGISQRKFSDMCGNKITHGYISMLEKNRNPNNGKPLAPSIEVYKIVAGAMGISFDDLIAKLDADETVTVNSNEPIMTDEEREMWELRELVRRDPQTRTLFKLARNANKQDILAAIAVLKSLKGDAYDE